MKFLDFSWIYFSHILAKIEIFRWLPEGPELGTLEWLNFNPDFLIRISTVETFHFCPNPLFFPLFGYPLIVFSNENISVLSFYLIGCYSFSDDYSFSYTFKIILQDYVNLEIIKKRGSSINPDIHHSKVFSSVFLFSIRDTIFYKIGFEQFLLILFFKLLLLCNLKYQRSATISKLCVVKSFFVLQELLRYNK